MDERETRDNATVINTPNQEYRRPPTWFAFGFFFFFENMKLGVNK